MSNKKLTIRNSTAEFLIFTSQANEDGIEVRVEDENVWLTQKLIGIQDKLFESDFDKMIKKLKLQEMTIEIFPKGLQNFIL